MKILYVGDSPTVTTGFGVVSDNLIKQFIRQGHEITVLGINHYGNPYNPNRYPYRIYPCDKGGVEAMYGYRKLWWLVTETKPDLIFFLNDPWVIEKYLEFKPDDVEAPRMMAYYPIDAGPMKKNWLELLEKKFVAQVCYSNFAENVVISSLGHRPKNLHQIYHGVDTKTFFPVNQSLARARLGIPANAFVVGMVARNQQRKRFDLLIRAFAEFAQDKPEAKLYIHTALEDVGFDIPDLIKQAGLDGPEKRMILTPDMRVDKGVPAEMLNMIYNCMDVNVLLSLGDGFGLPVAESMATAVPQLVSDHSCLKELVEGSNGGMTVKNAAWIAHTQGINTFGGVPDVDDTVKKLNVLYNNKNLRIELAQNAYNYITQEKFQWPYIGDQFNQIIKDTFHIIN